jgi:hypothetical protein
MSSNELIRRNRYKWTVNEILSLQREYELYELSIQEIALLHKRSAFSILHKLEKEQIINNFNEARGFDKINFWDDEYHTEDEQLDEQDDDEPEHDDPKDDQVNNEENVNNLSLQVPSSSSDSDSYSDSDSGIDSHSDHPEIVSHTQNIDDIDVVYFEDELMKKVQSGNNKKRYDNMTLFDIVYELIERIGRLEDKIVSIETANSNSFFAFVKNWFYAKRIC